MKNLRVTMKMSLKTKNMLRFKISKEPDYYESKIKDVLETSPRGIIVNQEQHDSKIQDKKKICP